MSFFHGTSGTGPYFEGWYWKHQNPRGQSLALIPAFHIDSGGRRTTSLQVVSKEQSWWLEYSEAQHKKVCAGCGKEVSGDDIIKGFEIEPGRYVTLTNDEFEKAKSEKDRTIHILHFADVQDIRPIYYDKTYHVIPESGGDKAYELLRRCMLDEKTVAIAKGVIGQSEHLIALIPAEKGILAETLFYHDEVKPMPKEPIKAELSEQELTMGRTIISGMKEAFDPAKYHDEYRERLWEIIQAKANNQVIAQAPAEQQVSIINMMDALQQMVEQTKARKSPPKRPRTRKKASV